jgi:hypothetical protein
VNEGMQNSVYRNIINFLWRKMLPSGIAKEYQRQKIE